MLVLKVALQAFKSSLSYNWLYGKNTIRMYKWQNDDIMLKIHPGSFRFLNVFVCAQVLFMSACVPLRACVFSSPDFYWRHLQGRNRLFVSGLLHVSLFPLTSLYVYVCLLSSSSLFAHVYICWSDLLPIYPSSCSVSLWPVGWQRWESKCDLWYVQILSFAYEVLVHWTTEISMGKVHMDLCRIEFGQQTAKEYINIQ